MHATQNSNCHKRMTISIVKFVSDGLLRIIGKRKINQLLEGLAQPHVVGESLEDAYARMANDEQREAEALDWAETFVGDSRGVANSGPAN